MADMSNKSSLNDDKPPRRRRRIRLVLKIITAMLGIVGTLCLWQFYRENQKPIVIRELASAGDQPLGAEIMVPSWFIGSNDLGHGRTLVRISAPNAGLNPRPDNDAFLEEIHRWDSHRSLDSVDASNAQTVATGPFPDCKILLFIESAITESMCAKISLVESLEKLELVCSAIESSSFEHLSRMPNLKTLIIYGNPGINLSRVSELKQLENLILVGVSVTDEIINGNLERLTSLELHYCELSESSFRRAHELQNLTTVHFYGEVIDDEQFTDFCTLKNLRTLSLCDTPINDAGLNKLAASSNLRNLDLVNDVCSASAVDDLTKQMPELQVTWLYLPMPTQKGPVQK